EPSRGLAPGAADSRVKPVKRADLAAILRRLRPASAGGSVLVVEDEPVNREVLCRMLRREGWSVTEAHDGPAALDSVAAAPPDLILLDLMLPKLDGFGVLQRLRAAPAHRAIPVV